ncbi:MULTISPECIES: SDR family oxidoreductase [Streptomyces]|uniref:NAD(P)H-binding protein n=1 Tax=Streptomyces edwardsiae TaxID=3075527 RepID=A0ABU2QKF7_9ACTN|nr:MULTISPECIES: NAD(P)H-binding protein [unclassified Streptomyces]MDT0403455.1 NAD(P)H-binding protein [Streptomyces sp. DSM 41635]
MFVVTGATGNAGRELVRILAADGERVTATSRSISAADVPEGVRHRRADLTDTDSLRAVFDGAGALFLQNGGASAHLLEPHGVLDAAKAAGIARVVLLSSQGVVTRPRSASHGQVARTIEDAVRQSGLDWTILRPGGFHSNALAWAEPVRTRRTVVAPFGDVGLPTIDPADIAAVAAVTLRGAEHGGHAYELTGPARTTPRQRAEAIGQALGEPVRFMEQTRDEARAQMRQFMPEEVVDTTLDILGAPTPEELRAGLAVEDITGRPPRTFADWARRHAALFR